jgi:hypothetical protein
LYICKILSLRFVIFHYDLPAVLAQSPDLIENLEPRSEYEVMVQAVSKHRWGEPSSRLVFMTNVSQTTVLIVIKQSGLNMNSFGACIQQRCPSGRLKHNSLLLLCGVPQLPGLLPPVLSYQPQHLLKDLGKIWVTCIRSSNYDKTVVESQPGGRVEGSSQCQV